MRLGRSRPIPALLLRRAAPATAATASLTIDAFHFALPWLEDFSGGDWSAWTTSPGRNTGTSADALTVTAGAGVLSTSNIGASGGGRAYPTAALGSVSSVTDQGVLLTVTPSSDVTSSDRLSVVLRGDGTWGAQGANTTAPRPGTGYRLEVVPGSVPNFRVDSAAGATETTPSATSVGAPHVTVTAGVPIKLRFEVVGARLQSRSWLVGDAEPTGSLRTTNADNFTAISGIFGLAAYFLTAAATYTVDDITWYVPAGAAPGAASGTASLTFVATATATATDTSTPATGTASLTFAASAAAAAPATATAALTVAAGTVTAKAAGTATAALTVNATAAAQAPAAGPTAALTVTAGPVPAAAPSIATAALTVTASGTAKAPVSGLSAALSIVGTGTGKAPAGGSAQLTIAASAVVGGLPATGSAALTIAATLAAAARAATLAALTINAGTTAGTTASAQANLDLAAALTAAARAATTAALTINAVATPATQGGYVKVWAGSQWLTKPARVWTGTAWPQKPVKVWTGTAWKTTT